jgi:uncharacterized membrane protein
MVRTLGLSLVICGSIAQAAQAGRVVVIGDEAGFLGPQVQALSADGRVAGGSDLFTMGFRWDGSFIPVPALSPGGASFVRDLSQDGSVAVGSASDGTHQHPIRWTAPGGTVSLGTLDPGRNGVANAVSADGSVAVGTSGAFLFRWTQSGGMVALAGIVGTAWDVSGDGEVVVGHSFGSVTQAFRWTQASGHVGLGALPEHEGSWARAISSDGTTIVGGSYDEDAEIEQPFRWTQSEGMVALGNLPGCRITTATNVSGDGGVMAGECWLEDGLTRRPFVWTAGTGLRSLEDFLALRGVALGEPLVAPWVTAVSDDGSVLAVVDEDPNLIRSFLIDVTLPLPASPPWPLLALGLAFTGFVAARRRTAPAGCAIRTNPGDPLPSPWGR